MSVSPAPSSSSLPVVPSIVIIGGGPCGLGSAFRLHELSLTHNVQTSWSLYDQLPTAGGLASSIVDSNGFTWDIGGHVIFSHFAYFTSLLDSLIPFSEWNYKVREAWIFMRDIWVPYPLQVNIHRLPQSETIDIIDGLIDLERLKGVVRPKPSNFREWLQQSFGDGLCRSFMFPYNFKVWAFDPSHLNVEWMGERVATVDTKKVIANVIAKKDDLGWGPNNKFRFPLHGGTGNIWKRLHSYLPKERFHFERKVKEVWVKEKMVLFEDGQRVHFDYLISSMPLDQLVLACRGCPWSPEQAHEMASKFRYSSSHIIGIGLEGTTPPHLSTKCWMYFPEPSSPFYRATVFSNYSPNVCRIPHKQWAIMCEISESADKSPFWPHSKEHMESEEIKGQDDSKIPYDAQSTSPLSKYLIRRVLDGLIATTLITKEDAQQHIVTAFHRSYQYGYPTPFVGRDALIDPILSKLESYGIYSRGRFGRWKYEVSNQDHSMMQGVEAVDRILFGAQEMTANFPSTVNAGGEQTGRKPHHEVLEKVEKAIMQKS